MHDEFAAERLPDIPNAGYQTRREKETSDAVMIFLRSLERDRPLLLLIVAEGPEMWRKRAGKVWKGLLVTNELLDKTYEWLRIMAGPDPLGQLKRLMMLQKLTPVQRVWGG